MSVKEDEASIPIAYTVWSFKKGAGKKIMKELQKYIKSKDQFESIVTLSPLTPVATHYHIPVSYTHLTLPTKRIV